MIVYVPIGSGPLRERYIELGHGMIANRPAGAFGIPKYRCPWIVDNGAYDDFLKHRPFDERMFLKRIGQLMELPESGRPEWVVCPDKVASRESLAFSTSWRRRLPDELNWYLAIQDGMERDEVHLAVNRFGFDGLFIGGSTRWKNERAWYWVELAHEWGLKAHLGRANGPKRLQWAINIGADSLDGTGWTRDSRWVKCLEEMPKKERHLWAT